MNSKELRGVIVPVITPVDENDNVDEASFRKLIRRLIGAGVHGIFTGGSAGEGPLLALDQWRRMVEIARAEVGGKVPVLGGVMDTSARKVCEKIGVLRKIGYSYFVLTPTFYLPSKMEDEHLRLFAAARDAAGGMEMIAYNIPQCTGATLAVETICKMAERGWIRYCKESSGDAEYFAKLVRKGKEVGLSVLAGDEKTAGDGLLAGAKGVVPVCANYDPQAYMRLYEAGVKGDRAGVAREMRRIEFLRDNLPLSGPLWLAGVKYAIAALGIGSGKPVSPLEPANAQQRKRIDAIVKAEAAKI